MSMYRFANAEFSRSDMSKLPGILVRTSGFPTFLCVLAQRLEVKTAVKETQEVPWLSRERMEGGALRALSVGELVVATGNTRCIQFFLYNSRVHKKRNNLKNTTQDREPVSIIYYTRIGSSIKQPIKN